MLQPQGEMLRVKPDPTEDMADETKENIQADAMPPGKKAAEPETGSPRQPALLDPGALQQVVLQSGALEVILDAVKAAGMATPQGMYMLSRAIATLPMSNNTSVVLCKLLCLTPHCGLLLDSCVPDMVARNSLDV